MVCKVIPYAVKEIWLVKFHMIAHLLSARLALIHQFVVYISTEIAIVLQEVGSHLHTCVGRHLSDGDRLRGKSIEEPLVEAFPLLVHQSVVGPKPYLQWISCH